ALAREQARSPDRGRRLNGDLRVMAGLVAAHLCPQEMPGTRPSILTSACVAWAFLSISSERRGAAITDPQTLGYALLHTPGGRRPGVNRVEKVLLIARQRIVDVEIEEVALRAGGYEPGQRSL